MTSITKSSKHGFVAPGTLNKCRSPNLKGSKVSFISGLVSKPATMCSRSSEKQATMTSFTPQVDCEDFVSPNLVVQRTSKDKEVQPTNRELHKAVENPCQSSIDENNNILVSAQSTTTTTTPTPGAETVATETETPTTDIETRKRKRRPDAKPRGVNKCKKVADLREGQKLEVDYYNNGPVGVNQKDMARHMGKIVRDRTICPVGVHSWGDISSADQEHMWQSLLNKFTGRAVELNRKTSL